MIRRLRWLWSLSAWLLVAGAGGCSSYRPPAMTVDGATISEISEEAVRADIALDLVNPNREPLELRQLDYTVSVGGSTIYVGTWAVQSTLAASGQRRLLAPVVIRHDRLPSGVSGDVTWSIQGRLLYVTPGELAELLLDTGVRKPRQRFAGEGVIQLP